MCFFPCLFEDNGRTNGWGEEYWTRASSWTNWRKKPQKLVLESSWTNWRKKHSETLLIRKVIAVNFQMVSFLQHQSVKVVPSPWPKWSTNPHSAILKGANISNIPPITASNISCFYIFSIQSDLPRLSYDNM